MKTFLKNHGPTLAIFGAVALVWFLVRIPSTPLESIDDLDARIAQGTPIVLEFFSNT